MSNIDRFWSRTQADGRCLMWTGSVDKKGYARFSPRGGKTCLGHRWIYQEILGHVDSSRPIMHACDRPGCVSLQHLSVGTHRMNTRDSIQKGRMSSAINPGDRFVRLTVADEADKGSRASNSIHWQCICDCGASTIVDGSHLRSGHTKSCGCLSAERFRGRRHPAATMLDIGQRFSRLVVLEKQEDDHKRNTWRCRCDCGKETIVRASALIHGRNRSCGCLKIDLLLTCKTRSRR